MYVCMYIYTHTYMHIQIDPVSVRRSFNDDITAESDSFWACLEDEPELS